MFDKAWRGLITWRELSALMKALGIPEIPIGLLNRASAHTPENSPGLEYKPFLHLLHTPLFETSLDYTYNRHNSAYNIRVIKKAISLVVDGILNLEDLQSARMGFTLYEGETCNGIQLEAASVAAAMRVTGKAIAPRKLLAWLGEIEEDVPGRLQLYEFLDLVKLCNDRNEESKAIASVATTIERSRAGLFELTDSNFLLTPGQKLAKHMDEDYDNMVNLINSQQVPARENLASSAKKRTPSPDTKNYSVYTRSATAEEGLELYGRLRESIRSTTSQVQAARSTRSSSRLSSRPQSVSLLDRNARLPSLRLHSSAGERGGPRSASAPSMRSMDSQKSARVSDNESINYDGTREREAIPRHVTSSAPLVRSGLSKGSFDDGEFALPERRLENYDTLRGYIAANGEASLSRIVTSSIGASHKLHNSPPPSPHYGTRLEDRKKRTKSAKRAFEDYKKTSKPIYKDHRFSMETLANNLEDIINGSSTSHSNELPKSGSHAKKPSSTEGSDNEYLPNTGATEHSPAQARIRPRNASDPVRNITFNLSPAGE